MYIYHEYNREIATQKMGRIKLTFLENDKKEEANLSYDY